LVVLDPDTGAIRWQAPAEGPIAFYDSVLVTSSSTERVVRARDWITGDEKWRAPYTGEQPIYVQALAAPLTESVRWGGGSAVDPADHWLLRPDADGTVHVIDARTGAELAARQGTGEVAPNQTAYVPYGHTLYTIVQEPPARVIRHDLDRTDPPTEVYASTGERVDNVAPCGAGRLCVLVSPQVVGGTRQLVVLDEVGGRELWRAPVSGDVSEIQAVGDRIIVGSGDLFTLDGQQLATGAALGFSVWVSAGNALTFGPAGAGGSPIAIGVMSTVDGSRTHLGQIPPTVGACGWSQRFLVCPAADGFQAWRFAAG
jgi:outer membrane protein assembly factor BamB